MRDAVILGALLLSLGACAAADDASTSDSNLTEQAQPSMLVLGDSIAFAWDPLREANDANVVATNYKGYADMLGQRFDLRVDNAACPGETSGSFVDKTADDNGCRHNRATYALHTSWNGADTQLDFTKKSLETSIARGAPPAFVTVSLGGNDLLLVKKACDQGGLVGSACQVAHLPFAEHDYGEHIKTILRGISGAGYHGKVVLVTTYAPDYSDKIAGFALGRLNGEIAESVRQMKGELQLDVRIADGFGAFEAKANEHGGKTCETGLLIKKPDGTCDIHPTEAGHVLLTDAIAAALK